MAITFCTNPNAGENYNPNTWSNTEEATASHIEVAHDVSWEGCVLGTGEHNWYDDSDFYALVWDEEEGRIRKIQYATTRGWTYHNGATVDATPEVISKAVAWQTQILVEDFTAETIADKEKELRQIEKGMEVRSTTTRGKNKGVVGIVEWIGENSYGPGMRVGIRVDGETSRRYLDMERVERTDLPGDMAEVTKLTAEEIAEIRRHAIYRAQSTYCNA
jgi:hypothetical protein